MKHPEPISTVISALFSVFLRTFCETIRIFSLRKGFAMSYGVSRKVGLRYLIVCAWLFYSLLLMAGTPDCLCAQKKTATSSCCGRPVGTSTQASSRSCCPQPATPEPHANGGPPGNLCDCLWRSDPCTCLGHPQTESDSLYKKPNERRKDLLEPSHFHTPCIANTREHQIAGRCFTPTKPSSGAGQSINVLLCVFLC